MGGYTFQIRQGNPKAVSNLYHKELGCSWMGVGGRILDLSDTPVTGLVIKLGGELLGAAIPDNAITMAGLASSYGESGYEFALSDQPIASSGQLWVQVTGQSGEPLSERTYFDTYESCEQNLILIDFVQIR